MISFILIGILLHYRIKGSFLIGLFTGTILYILSQLIDNINNNSHIIIELDNIIVNSNDFTFSFDEFSKKYFSEYYVYRLLFDLFIIGIILLNGLAHSLCEMANLLRENKSIPRGKWLYFSIGVGSIFSSFVGAGYYYYHYYF